MKYFIFILLVLLALFKPRAAKAETHDELLHFTAHASSAFAITLVTDQVCSKMLRLSPGSSMLAGVTTAILAGSIYKLVETRKLSSVGDNMLYNGAGAIGAVGTILVFDLNVLGE